MKLQQKCEEHKVTEEKCKELQTNRIPVLKHILLQMKAKLACHKKSGKITN